MERGGVHAFYSSKKNYGETLWAASPLRRVIWYEKSLEFEDVVQEAITRLLEHERPGDEVETPRRLACWMARCVAASAARSAATRGKYEPAVVLGLEQAWQADKTPEEALEDARRTSRLPKAVADALKVLSGKERERVDEFLANNGERPSCWEGSQNHRTAWCRALKRLRTLPELLQYA